MPIINKVLIGFASVVCTAVTFSAALSPAIPTMQQKQVRVMYEGIARDTKFQIMAGLSKQSAVSGATTCVSQARQRAAQCGNYGASVGPGRVLSLLD